jgi:hypothetical protein
MSADADFLADPFGGKGRLIRDEPFVRTWLLFDDEGRLTAQCEVQRVDPILEENERRRAATAGKRWGDGQIVASIPNVIFWHGDYARAREARDDAWIKRFLNDRDNYKLRTKEGRL